MDAVRLDYGTLTTWKTGVPEWSGRAGVRFKHALSETVDFNADIYGRFSSNSVEKTESETTHYNNWQTANVAFGFEFGDEKQYTVAAEVLNLFDVPDDSILEPGLHANTSLSYDSDFRGSLYFSIEIEFHLYYQKDSSCAGYEADAHVIPAASGEEGRTRMPSQVFNRHYAGVRGSSSSSAFSRPPLLSTLLVALVGRDESGEPARQEPHFHHAARGHALHKARRGRWLLFVLVNMLISMPRSAARDALPAMLLAAGCAEAAMACSGGCGKPAPPCSASRCTISRRKFFSPRFRACSCASPALLYVIVPIVVIGYVGSLCGLFSGVRAVRELRHGHCP